MSLKFNTDQQRIEASSAKPTGRWTNATYSRSASGLVNIVSVAHGIIATEKLYIDFLTGGETDGTYTVTKVDDDNLSFQSSSTGVITAGQTLAYKRVRSLSIQGDESLEISVGTGALEKDAIFINKNVQENVRVGINTTDPQFELDVEGQIRTTRSIISDTAQVTNLDIDTIINPALNLRGPNLINFEDTDVTSPTFGTTFYPTADTPELSDQSRRVATTDFVYKVATNDTGGRVYVSSTIGDDSNDGRSAARPVATIKKAAQIAYGLQKATPDPDDEYVSIIVSGGEYFEDNPISLPRNCSLIGDNLRRVIVRPQNQDRHMIKASNETYIFGVVFRDALQNPSDPQSTVIHTWKYAFVFDDKQRLYYEPELGQIPSKPGDKFRGENIFKVTFNNHTGSDLTLLVNAYLQGGSSGTQGRVQSVNFTGPQASPNSTGDVTVLVTSGVNDVFQDAEKIFYSNTSFASIITDINNPSVSDRFDVIDAESLRPELETISNQIYQHTVDAEREELRFFGRSSVVNTTNDTINIPGHGLKTGHAVFYEKYEDTVAVPGLIDQTVYYVRTIDADNIELYDTYTNASAATNVTQGRRDFTGEATAGVYHKLTSGAVMPESNNIYIERHQFKTGDGVTYRAGKMGVVGGLTNDVNYFVYRENDDWIRLAASAADAVNKAADGSDDPTTIDITSPGLGFQRFDVTERILTVSTIDTSLNTVATYNGPIFNLATSSISSDFHDYEVGTEVQLYGFTNSAINFGGSVNSAYTISGGEITVTLSSVDNGLTSALFADWITLGEGGLTFNFPGEDDRYSKTYHIGQFDLGSGTPTLPSNTDLGMGYARYNSSNTTVTIVLKQSDSPTTGDNIVSSSGSGVSVLDNVADLNGRKYITHRIERADGYSLQFVVRANITNVSATLNPTGDQTVIGSANYVLASLRNSPFGFDAVNISDRFRDGGNAIKTNQEFIAEEAYAYVKSHYENSITRTSSLTVGPTTFSAQGERVTRPITSWSVAAGKATFLVKRGHNLFSSDAGTATQVTIASSGNGTVNGTYAIDDILDDKRFIVNLGSSAADGQTGTAGTFNDFQKPFRTPGSEPFADRYADAADAIYSNAEMIAEVAVGKMLAANGGFTIPTGNQACIDDVKDFLQLAMAHNLRWGGNDRVYDAANYYVRGAHVAGEQDRSVEVFNYARDFAIQVIRNLPVLRHPHSTIQQYYEQVTLDTVLNNSVGDAANQINTNLAFIAAEAVERYTIANQGFSVPGGNQNCIDDVVDVLRSLTYNLAHGGNDAVYDAASYYTGTTHVDGEETETQAIFNNARDIAKQVLNNETVTVQGTHGLTQVKDLTITVDPGGCAAIKSSVDTLMAIVTTAVANDNMSHATRTAATNATCADVASSITTLTTVLTNAIGTNSGTGNLNGVTRTVASGDIQCIDDVQKILRAFSHDLRYGGNSKTIEAANLYISGGSVAHVPEEVEFTRATFAVAKELAIDAIRNQLEDGQFSQIAPVGNGSITVDSSAPECANVVSALVTNWGILDNVLSSGTAYSGTVTAPDPVITEQDNGLYSFPLLSNNLDLPVIEASPYIQNSSLISFLGGSGCEIDGAKVATPNVPRPGLKLNAQGNTVANFDPQGKSMVANAFTIISFGGTAYNISNDGYTQLVSVFAIFCQDGILCQSGGYASVTNSASNFGTFALRATGFRADPYDFDIGVIDNISDDLDGNGVPTGRNVIRVSGTNLTNIPVEDYIIRIGGTSPTDPATEHIILETTVISGSVGSQVTADIVTNRAMDYTDSTSGDRYQSVNSPFYVAGSLPLSNLHTRSIQFHRPSVCNSSSHTWEFSGSGNTYAALPQNGGVGLGTAYEASEQSFGQVYTSGTNEFGDFKVGNFVTIFNRTGSISFVGTVSISELSSIKIVGGAITITGFSDDDNLGGTFASDALLPTQASVRDYISNNLGPYLNQPYSTNAVPSALVQLTSSGKINIDQIPALRPFNITSVTSQAERLAIEDANAGDIAIETTATTFSVPASSVITFFNRITITGHGTNTGDQLTYNSGTTAIQGLADGNVYYVIKVSEDSIELAATESNAQNGTNINLQSQGSGTHTFTTQGTAISYILENDLESQFLAFAPNSNYAFAVNDIIVGSSTTARGTVQAYNDGLIYNFAISDGGSGYTGDFALTIGAPDDPGGTQAAATANVVNGSVTKVTITNKGAGYYTQPTVQVQVSPGGAANNASISAQIEARVDIDIANNIKFDAGDFILDQSLANEGTGTYSQSGTTITVSETGHNLSNVDLVYLDFTSGGASDGFFTVSVLNANQFTVTSLTSATLSGNVNRKRIIDLTRAINTSASNAANWTQLTSTNIDASNIVAGVIDPERMAGKGTANSYTFLRGDSSWEYALQSIRPTTQDALVVGGSLSDSSYIDSITITAGGTGYTDGTYQNIPMDGGNVSISSDNVARATYIVSGGVIISASVTDSGTGYTGNFSVTVPSELGGGNGAILNAVKGTINRAFGNIEIDIKKGDNLTPSATVFGNYGVFRFRKDVANQAVGNQDQGGFIVDNNGNVSIDQGPGSELNADKLDGNQGSFYQTANNILFGTLDPARLANTTYNISISGTADTANRIFNETAAPGSNPGPSQATNGVAAALRNNAATGLSDGGSTHGVVTYRRQATGTASTQLGFTDNNNLYIRGNTGGNAVYSNWAKIWSSANDGAGSGSDADLLEGKQGLWYQSGYNVGDTRAGISAPIGDMFLPEVLGQDKMVFENFYVNDTGNKYTFYIPDFHCRTGTGGNINPGGTYTIYSDVGATNNIGSIVVDSGGTGVQELTHTTGEIYSLVTGTVAFVGSNSNANVYVFGPNPGTKWTVSSSNKVSSGSTTIIGLRDDANGAKLQIGKAATSTTPTIDFRSSGQAPVYDVQMIVSGGNSSNGNGTLRINAGDLTINGNTIWHSGNDGSSSQLDAHYLDGYTQTTSASANTIARRDGSGHLTVNDLYADQGIFSNNGTGTLSLADGNGITIGKAATNVAVIKGKQNSSVGYLRFGNDSNSLGWNGSYLNYNNVTFRNGRIGIGDTNPGSPLEIVRQGSGSQLFADFRDGRSGYHRITFGGDGSSPFMTFSDTDNDTGWQLGADDNNQSWFVVRGFTTSSGALGTAFQGAKNNASLAIYSATNRVFMNKGSGVSTGGGSTLNVGGAIETDNQLKSTVATGTAPLSVNSTTKVTNLNADLLDGYSALNLPYLQGTVNQWINDAGGQPRFYFSNNSHTFFRTGDNFYWRSDNDTSMGSVDGNGGTWTFYSGGDQNQTTYRVEVRGQNGLNINTSSVGLSGGQRAVVLRADGDKQWIDRYGVFKRNRNTISESVTVNNGDNCMTAGPITINNNVTVTINNGGSWSVV